MEHSSSTIETGRFNNHEITLMLEKVGISINARLDEQDKTLSSIEVQTKKTNGRVNKIERTILIMGCIVGTLLITNGSELVKFIMSLI